MPKRLARRYVRLIVCGELLLLAALEIAGYIVVSDSVTTDHYEAGVAGALLATVIWLLLAWAFAFGLRGYLVRRGYDVAPRATRRVKGN